MTEIVITGLGSVSACGCGRASLAAALAEGRPRLVEVDRSAGYHRAGGSRLAALTGEQDLRQWVAPMVARRMSPSSRWAVAAAGMALTDAGSEATQARDPRLAVVMATAYGAASVTEKILLQILREGPEAVSPALFTESVANAPAAQVALSCGARGMNLTVTQRQAGPLAALAVGAREVASGRADRALVGAVDELSPLIHSILDRFQALARAESNGAEVARPFDRHRSGFLAADGSAVVLLEREEDARQRGARVLARVLHTGGGFDPGAGRVGLGPDPRPLAAQLERFLARSGLVLAAVDRIVSGACGGPQLDRAEALLLRSVWGERSLPTVLAPKGVAGEHGGGLLAAAVLTAAGAEPGPTAGFVEPDPELGLVPHDGHPLPAPRTLLVTSLAVGGAASWVLLGAGDR